MAMKILSKRHAFTAGGIVKELLFRLLLDNAVEMASIFILQITLQHLVQPNVEIIWICCMSSLDIDTRRKTRNFIARRLLHPYRSCDNTKCEFRPTSRAQI
mmetsp:Transcript_4360/g.8019  ORF Transcript_4360/g.8019 Transcript_4360/m.8019 type:complete len:101 (+) Transcript_4360:177-479(+)